MATIFERQIFDPSCPSGGSWFACGYGSRFVGCCLDSNPCDGGCNGSNLKPASFDKEHYSDIPGSNCPEGSEWWTCAATEPSFLGCCVSNPCSLGSCPTADLRAASLSTEKSLAAPYSAIPNPSSTVVSSPSGPPSSASSATKQTLTVGSTAAVTSTSASSSSTSSSTSTGAVVGAVIGGLAAITILAAIAFFFMRRHRRQHRGGTVSELPEGKETPATSYHDSSSFATPMYTSSNLSTPGHPPFHELETPPPDPWHAPKGRAYEMPSPNLRAEKKMDGESKDGLGIYSAVDGDRFERYELGEGRDKGEYELDGEARGQI